MKQYAFELLIALDRMVNAILGGSCDETLSARAWAMHLKGQPYWGWTYRAINTLFFWQHDHCQGAYLYERSRWSDRVKSDEAGAPIG